MSTREQDDLEREDRIARLVSRRAEGVQIPPFAAVERRIAARNPLPLAALSTVAVLILAVVIGGALADRRASSASPSPTLPVPTTTATATPTRTPAVSPTTTPLSLHAERADVPTDFHYIESWPGRILVLDLSNRRATEIATYTGGSTEPGFPNATLSASRDGRTLLVLVRAGPLESTLYVLTPQSGGSRILANGAIEAAVISPDGLRFAIARHDQDRTLTGLWVGSVSDGASRRLVADDPNFAAAPPVPFAFSPSASLLTFGLGVGDSGYRAAVVALSSSEIDAAQLRDPAATVPGVTLLDFASGAEFVSDQRIFVWSSRTAFGGKTIAYLYDLLAQQRIDLYAPGGDVLIVARWRPGTQQFATIEQPSCCGVNLPRTPWLRDTDGTARALAAGQEFVGDVWWSADGSKLYATIGGDDSTGGVVDFVSGANVMQFCKRGGNAPGSCV